MGLHANTSTNCDVDNNEDDDADHEGPDYDDTGDDNDGDDGDNREDDNDGYPHSPPRAPSRPSS